MCADYSNIAVGTNRTAVKIQLVDVVRIDRDVGLDAHGARRHDKAFGEGKPGGPIEGFRWTNQTMTPDPMGSWDSRPGPTGTKASGIDAVAAVVSESQDRAIVATTLIGPCVSRFANQSKSRRDAVTRGPGLLCMSTIG